MFNRSSVGKSGKGVNMSRVVDRVEGEELNDMVLNCF